MFSQPVGAGVKHAARVGAVAVALGLGAAVASPAGVAAADETASTSTSESPSSEANSQPATDPQPPAASPQPTATAATGSSERPARSRSKVLITKRSTAEQSVVTLDRGVIIRSSGGAHTRGAVKDAPDVPPNLPDQPAVVVELESEPVTSDEPQVAEDTHALSSSNHLAGELNSKVRKTEPQLKRAEDTERATFLGVMKAKIEALDTVPKPTVTLQTQTQAKAITIPPLPLPGPNSPEPIQKAWGCFCNVFTTVAPIAQKLGGVINEYIMPLLAGPAPGETPDSPALWAVLGWVRRQADQILSAPPISDFTEAVTAWGTLTLQQVTQSCGEPTEGLPAELERTVIVSGLSEPVDFRFLPDDGGILIAEKGGAIKLYQEGQGTTTVVVLPTKTDFESGIGGIEVDPNFAENHYVYVSYTNGNDTDVLSRFTLSGDQAAILASEKVLIASDEVAGPIHHGGEIYYEDNPGDAADYIYWAKGDNSVSTNAQDLTNIHGKIMRIHPDGTIPTDNPFYNTPGARKEIWAYGLRNPFRFDVAPNGQLLVGDVGDTSWEELNVVTKGANYGWPGAEGVCVGCGYVNPIYSYDHNTPAGTASITSVLVYTGDTFPEEYQGKVFVADYTLGWIKVLTLDENYASYVSEQPFDGQAGTPVRLIQGPDGNIYQLNIYPGELSVIAPSGGNRAPTAVLTATPSNGYSPLVVEFSSQGSGDPDPDTALTYHWDFGDGTTSTQANPTKTYDTNGTYHVTLTVSDGEKTGQDTQSITVGSTAPHDLTITTPLGGPLDNTKYNAGDTISFTGSALDQDETLPDSAYNWTVVFHHADHIHPVTSNVVGKTGSITVPTDPHNSADTWYEVRLTVTDSTGLSTTSSAMVYPNTVTQTFTASDPDAVFTIDGKPYTGSHTETSVVGVERVLGVPSPQYVEDGQLVFVSWSDGGAQTHTIVTPGTNTDYVVTFDKVPSVL
ncbi:PQQ-dependent sugar dehydrogenase [Mycolicibacterium farcinogenes]|uniref:PQQ-dependent sugar dehydrogenase n=1 Tax=Mycolicibacterium farcinogenes TaxID=1802 RepID=A0ACD1FLH1_MYCFR|nr:PQQ-dependent sugar dehydrogenase [Mycolicibacterium farcinogenes]QZH67830.1 PQQ-dependent sugar dehydrogenase [Mycolicibacterium farcinogenes]